MKTVYEGISRIHYKLTAFSKKNALLKAFSKTEAHLSSTCSTPKGQLKCCEGFHTANYLGCGEWEEFQGSACKLSVAKSGAPNGAVRSVPTRPEPSAEQLSLGDGSNHVLRGGRVAKAPSAPPPQPTPAAVAVAPRRAQTASTSKKARNKKHGLKVSAAPKKAPTKQTASTWHCMAKPTPTKQQVSPLAQNESPPWRRSRISSTPSPCTPVSS